MHLLASLVIPPKQVHRVGFINDRLAKAAPGAALGRSPAREAGGKDVAQGVSPGLAAQAWRAPAGRHKSARTDRNLCPTRGFQPSLRDSNSMALLPQDFVLG